MNGVNTLLTLSNPAPLSVKTILCESSDKCCEQSRHYANKADGHQAFYKYIYMKEQHQSPRITTENLTFRWTIPFLLQNKTPHIKQGCEVLFPFEKQGKEGDRPSDDFA